MNRKQILLGLVLVDFAAFSGYALWQHGFSGFFEIVLSSSASLLLLADLTIALSLVLAWMFRDARERGMAFLPYALLTLAFGSVGPLLYLIRREGHVPVTARVAGVSAARA
jgi:hypothetical protein